MKLLAILATTAIVTLNSCATSSDQKPCPCDDQLAKQRADLLAACHNSASASQKTSATDLNNPDKSNVDEKVAAELPVEDPSKTGGLDDAYLGNLEPDDVEAKELVSAAAQEINVADSTSQPASNGNLWVKTKMLNIRTGPGTNFPSVGVVLLGEELTPQREESGWIQIGEGRFVAKDFLSSTPVAKPSN